MRVEVKCTCNPDGAVMGSACEYHTLLADWADEVKASAAASVYLALKSLNERQSERLYGIACATGPCPEMTLITYGMFVALGVSVYGMTDFRSMDEAAKAGSELITALSALDVEKEKKE